jgi:hypothetical protein
MLSIISWICVAVETALSERSGDVVSNYERRLLYPDAHRKYGEECRGVRFPSRSTIF